MPPGPNPFQQVGARPSRESQGAPLFYNRFIGGLVTQRNPLRDPSGVVQERWYGGKGDALLDGLNLELSNRLTWVRAPGSTPFTSANIVGSNAPKSFFPFKQFQAGQEAITLFADSPTVIQSFNPTTAGTAFTKAAGAGPAYFFGINNTLYIADGAEQVAFVPAGIGNLTFSSRNWGISIGGFAAVTSKYAGAAADTGGGGISWTNPGNATGAPDGAYATATVHVPGSPGLVTDYLDLTTYGFGLAGVVQGIQASITCLSVFNSGGSTAVYLTAQLLLNGNVIGTSKQLLMNSGSAIHPCF